MKLHPMLFSTSMVQALLANQKTQTRRILKPQPPVEADSYALANVGHPWHDIYGHNGPAMHRVKCPYGQPGDVIWVRETWRKYCVTDPETGIPDDSHVITEYAADGGENIQMVDGDGFLVFNADGSEKFIPWKPSIHMPYVACRLWLEIVSVRVERLQDISETDAKAEGATQGIYKPYGINSCQLEVNEYARYRDGYHFIWHNINGPDSWDANPFVWVVEFKRTEKP